jgi:hypothetical protein
MTDTANRRAALTLHGLAPGDRQWILTQLSTPDQDKVSPFLDELTELGFPNEASEWTRSDRNSGQARRNSPGIKILDAAPSKFVHRILKDEQAATIAVVMNYFPWRWQSRMLRRLGKDKRQAVLRHTRDHGSLVGEAAQNAIIEAMACTIDRAVNAASPTDRIDLRGLLRW